MLSFVPEHSSNKWTVGIVFPQGGILSSLTRYKKYFFATSLPILQAQCWYNNNCWGFCVHLKLDSFFNGYKTEIYRVQDHQGWNFRCIWKTSNILPWSKKLRWMTIWGDVETWQLSMWLESGSRQDATFFLILFGHSSECFYLFNGGWRARRALYRDSTILECPTSSRTLVTNPNFSCIFCYLTVDFVLFVLLNLFYWSSAALPIYAVHSSSWSVSAANWF